MSKRSNNRFVTTNKNIEQSQPSKYRKCAFHVYSHNYAAHMRQHDELMEKLADKLLSVDMDSTFNIIIVFHFLAPKGSYNKDRVLSRAHDIIMSLNDDFNNYSNNPNTMNNFKYKSIINQVFIGNMTKQKNYLGQGYLKFLPTKPSNIIFELGEIYYYPVKNRLNLGQYNDIKDIEIEHQVIKQFIHQNRADAIHPDNLMNIWVIDMGDTSVLGFSNFPWEISDNYHGIIINRRCFFPEDYNETNFASFKTFTHEIGHYLGLLHVLSNNSAPGAYSATNINADCEKIFGNNDYITEIPDKLDTAYDPTDKNGNKKLHLDNQYNPLFMNFMDYTNDKYVTMFTPNQIQKMRFMLFTFRPKLNSITNKVRLPTPKYNPDTDTIYGIMSKNNNTRNPPLIPSRETINNPRLVAQGFTAQQPQIPPIQAPVQKNIQNNSKILQLIPNLVGNNIGGISSNNTKEQIIANIQNNLPPDPNVIAAEQASAFDKMMKQYQAYNSVDGYAKSYPYDIYTMQQYQNNMAMIQQHQQQQQQRQEEMLRKENEKKINDYYDYNDYNDRKECKSSNRKTFAPPLSYQGIPPMNPRFIPRVDPRYMMRMDPRYMMPPTGMPIDPNLMEKKKAKRIDQQIKQLEEKKNIQKQEMNEIEGEINDVDNNDDNDDNDNNDNNDDNNNDNIDDDINHDAVKKLRLYPKYAQAKSGTKKNCLDPKNKNQFTNLKDVAKMKNKQKIAELVSNNPMQILNHVPTHQMIPQKLPNEMEINTLTPSSLIERIDKIDDNIQDIGSKIPILTKQNKTVSASIPKTSQILAKATQSNTKSKSKFNKYGQTVDPVVSRFSKQDINRAPKKKFVRSKPLDLN